jgi:hypothetical protein
LQNRFVVQEIVCDPWQMARSIATLKVSGLRIRELPQTVATTTAFGQVLYDALKGKNLVMYADDELRQQAMNTVAQESTRGWRIAKEKTSKKIDAIVALAMACLAAVEIGTVTPVDVSGVVASGIGCGSKDSMYDFGIAAGTATDLGFASHWKPQCVRYAEKADGVNPWLGNPFGAGRRGF